MPRRHHEADSPTLSSEKLSRTQASTWHGAPKLMGGKERWREEPQLVITDEWRKLLVHWLDEERGRQTQLAKRLGVDVSAITWVKTKRLAYKSNLVLPICRITGLPPPGSNVDSEMLDDLTKLRERNPKAYEQLKLLARTFLNSK